MAGYLGNKELREKSNLNWEKFGTFRKSKKTNKQTNKQNKIKQNKNKNTKSAVKQYILSVPNL